MRAAPPLRDRGGTAGEAGGHAVTSGRSLRVGEALFGGLILGLGLFITIETASLQVAPSHATIGPKLFPYLVATGLLIVGALVLSQAFFGHIARERGVELDWAAIVIVAGGLVVQMLLIERLGWVIATTLLFVAVARAFGSRRWLLNAAIGLGLTVLTLVVFNWGLGLTLPVGTVLEPLFGDEAG